MKSAEILMIEDSTSDVELLVYLLKKYRFKNKLQVMYDGEDAVRLSQNRLPYDLDFEPDLILLDLNLPRVHGFEILKSFKESDKFSNTPIVVLSTSNDENDIQRAEELGAVYYIVKPISLDKLVNALSKTELLTLSIIVND